MMPGEYSHIAASISLLRTHTHTHTQRMSIFSFCLIASQFPSIEACRFSRLASNRPGPAKQPVITRTLSVTIPFRYLYFLVVVVVVVINSLCVCYNAPEER